MRQWIVLSPDGYTEHEHWNGEGPPTENMQVLGFATGNNEHAAFECFMSTSDYGSHHYDRVYLYELRIVNAHAEQYTFSISQWEKEQMGDDYEGDEGDKDDAEEDFEDARRV